MKFGDLRKGINMQNMHLFMACVSVGVLLIHVIFFFLMEAAGAGLLSYFNFISFAVYITCFVLFLKEKYLYQAYVLFFSEIFLFSTIMTWIIKYNWGFSTIVTPLIPLIGLLGFIFMARYQRRSDSFTLLSFIACLLLGINSFKGVLRPEIGLIDLSLSYQFIFSFFCNGIETVCMGIISIVSCSVAGAKNDEQNFKIERLSLRLVITLSQTVEAKDRYTNGHSRRVATYAEMIANAMGMSQEDQKKIYFCGLLHDIGKISISDEIINKKGKLTDEEYLSIKKHSEAGWNILKDIEEVPELAQVARWHHERYDGKGYPDGKYGSELPVFSRIVSVADAYDAMTSNRSYRSVMPQEKVISILEEERGKQFDPEIADVFLKIISKDVHYKLREQDDPEANKTVYKYLNV